VIDIADINLSRCNTLPGHLCVAAETQVYVGLRQHLCINGAVRAMASRATLSQSWVFKHKGPRLLFVTLSAVFIQPGHCQPACRLHDVTPVRIMALHAIHLLFQDRMMLRQVKFPFDRSMALETSRRILSRIGNEFSASATPLNMEASRAVACFATSLPGSIRGFQMNSSVGTGRKNARDFSVALHTRFIAHERCARNIRWRLDRSGDCGARIQHQSGSYKKAEGQDRDYWVPEAQAVG
jgi:hypothetical protein